MDKRNNKSAAKSSPARTAKAKKPSKNPHPPRFIHPVLNGHQTTGREYAEAATASATGSMVGAYMSMVLNPHKTPDSNQLCRYPDETIVPTGMVSLQDTITYTQGTAGGNQIPGTMCTALRWKVTNDTGETQWLGLPIATPRMLDLDPDHLMNGFGTGYAMQQQWLTLSGVDRTLAAGIRVRVTGYPPMTLLGSGTIYCLQYQNVEYASLFSALCTQGEAAARAAVAAKKGYAATIDEVKSAQGITLPYLPQGPMSFVFSDSNREAAAVAGQSATGISGLSSGVVSANGGLLIVAFGLQTGLQLRFDFGHIIEYVPSLTAAGLVSTAVQPPNSGARDAISGAVSKVQQAIAGQTSVAPIHSIISGGVDKVASFLANNVANAFTGAYAGFRLGGPRGALVGGALGLLPDRFRGAASTLLLGK